MFNGFAQEANIENGQRKLLLGAEGGIVWQFSKTPEFDFIRGDVLPFSSSGSSGELKAYTDNLFFGIKVELRDKSNLWGFLAGLKYSKIKYVLSKNDSDGSTSNYFYFLNQQNVEITEYFRVQEISRTINYLGVPVEIRRFFKRVNDFCFYIKLGAEVGIKLDNSSKVKFRNDAMNEYANDVIGKFDKPELFFASSYLSVGLNYDKMPNVDFEFICPYILLTDESSGMLNTPVGIGLKFEIKLPVN